MASTSIVYPRPPIAEAIIVFRFSADVTSPELLAVVQGALGDQYSGQRRSQDLQALRDGAGPAGGVTTQKKALGLTFLTSEDGLRIVGCGDGILSVHVLAPYPGWAALLEQATAVIRAATPLLEESGFHQIAVRYIDRIALPVDEGLFFKDCLTVFPNKPAAMPESLLGFQYATHSVDPQDGTTASMILASAPAGDDGRPVAIFDLTVWRQGCPLAGLDEAQWHEIVDVLHQRQREIFEASITDKLRETFQ